MNTKNGGVMRKLYAVLVAATLVLVAAPAANASSTRTLRVVALGDSYASGTGAGNYETGTEGTCWRSTNAASAVNVAKLRAAGVRVAFTNVTCSGATTQEMRELYKGQSPQLDSLTSNTDVVTLTVGASDIDFAGYGGLCIQADCSGAPTDAILARLPMMKQNVITLLNDIRTRSPRATIIFAGYGRQLNPGPNPAGVLLDPICGDGVVSPAERVDGNRVSSAFDQALRAAIRSARSRGVNVTFVSPYRDNGQITPSFSGHALCEADVAYYRGLEALAPGQEGPEAVLHLNSAGQAAMADLVERELLARH